MPPTRDKQQLERAIDSLGTTRGTAIGAAMLKSLDAIAEVNPNVKPVVDAGFVAGCFFTRSFGTASRKSIPFSNHSPPGVACPSSATRWSGARQR